MDPELIRRAYRRSRLLRDALRVLDLNGPMHLTELATRLSSSPHRVRAMIHGALPGHRPAYSPLRLGLIVKRRGKIHDVYAVLARGRAARALLEASTHV